MYRSKEMGTQTWIHFPPRNVARKARVGDADPEDGVALLKYDRRVAPSFRFRERPGLLLLPPNERISSPIGYCWRVDGAASDAVHGSGECLCPLRTRRQRSPARLPKKFVASA